MSSPLAQLAGIYPLADDDPRWRVRPRELVEAAFAGGARVVQLRLKHTGDGEALELARWASARAREAGAILIVNDRYDLADLAGAHGVHLGQDDLAPERIPAAVRERLLVGLSTHSLEQVRQSRDRPIDYVAFGPVFGTKTIASAYAPRGIEMLQRAVSEARHPLVAIGGLSRDNLPQVARAGASAASVISAIADSADPTGATRQLAGIFRTSHREIRRPPVRQQSEER